MNRNEFILSVINDALADNSEGTFEVVPTWHQRTALNPDVVYVYVYALDEVNILANEREDMSIDNNRIIKTRLGIKYLFSAASDSGNAPMTARYADTVARIEYVLRSIDLPQTTTDNYGATITVLSAILDVTFGYFDEERLSGDSAGIITVISRNTA